ncbi:MAG: hypothetical protein ACI3VB_08290 [Oscillospiraceae bacterium]
MIRNWISNFMLGRYGPDHLGVVLFVLAVAMKLVSAFVSALGFLSMLAYFILLLCIYRMLSRNIERRRAENDRFVSIFWPIKRKIRLKLEQLKSRKYFKFFKCPACGNILRVPKNKGRVKITCPKCGERFERRT